jgi:hypothetical protein
VLRHGRQVVVQVSRYGAGHVAVHVDVSVQAPVQGPVAPHLPEARTKFKGRERWVFGKGKLSLCIRVYYLVNYKREKNSFLFYYVFILRVQLITTCRME